MVLVVRPGFVADLDGTLPFHVDLLNRNAVGLIVYVCSV